MKTLTKGTGFIAEEHKFKSTIEDEKMMYQIKEEQTITNEEEINLISKEEEKKENFLNENNDEMKKMKKINTKKNQIISENDSKKSDVYLNEFEKNSLYALMGLVTENTQREKEDIIYSVEYLFESKYKFNATLTNKIYNSKMSTECKK